MSEGDLTAATPRPWTGGGEVIYGADGKVVLHVFGGPTRSAAERLGNAALVRAAVNGYEQRAAAYLAVVALASELSEAADAFDKTVPGESDSPERERLRAGLARAAEILA